GLLSPLESLAVTFMPVPAGKNLTAIAVGGPGRAEVEGGRGGGGGGGGARGGGGVEGELGGQAGGGVRLQEPGPGGLQPAHHGGGEPAAQLVAEGRVALAGRADRPGLELEPLHRLRGDPAEQPLVGRGEPGKPEHAAAAQRPDD